MYRKSRNVIVLCPYARDALSTTNTRRDYGLGEEKQTRLVLERHGTAGLVICQTCESSALESGSFRALDRPEALCFRAFWCLGRAGAKGEGLLRG